MQRHVVLTLVLPVLCLVGIGLVALFSTSAFASESNGDPHYFLQRQLVWIGMALFVGVAAAMIDYHFWGKTWWLWFGLAVALLILCFIPPIGLKINGSRRWINLGFSNFQPSELGKLAAVFFLAVWYSRFCEQARTLKYGMLYPAMIVGVLLSLIVTEVDIGTTGLIGCILVGVMFVAGANLKLLLPTMMAGVAVIVGAVLLMPERMGRVLAFMDLEKYKADEGYQQIQALLAFGSGGVWGLGIGNSRMKMHYLPFAHTDFIFPIIGEEMGLVTTLLVVFFYLLIFLSGCCIALYARDRFGLLLGFGLVFMITLQAIINIGVVTALLPNKGFPLPFISYGGSNILVCVFAIGVLINIYRQGLPTNRVVARNVLRTRVRNTPRI